MQATEAITNLRTMAMTDAFAHLPFQYLVTVVVAAIYIGIARRSRPKRSRRGPDD
jgi:hypothetical protein